MSDDGSFAAALAKRGIQNAPYPTEDPSDPDEHMLLRALDVMLYDLLEVALESEKPLKFEVRGAIRPADLHLGGKAMGTPRDRARTAAARAVAAHIGRTDERSMRRLVSTFNPERMNEPAYRDEMIARLVSFVRKSLTQTITGGGYAALCAAAQPPENAV